MTLMSRETGLNISYKDHVKQSINDILTTLPGERIFLNDYGASLRDLIDQPLNRDLIILAGNRVSDAITRYEPRVRVLDVNVQPNSTGDEFNVNIEVLLLEKNENLIIDGVIV